MPVSMLQSPISSTNMAMPTPTPVLGQPLILFMAPVGALVPKSVASSSSTVYISSSGVKFPVLATSCSTQNTVLQSATAQPLSSTGSMVVSKTSPIVYGQPESIGLSSTVPSRASAAIQGQASTTGSVPSNKEGKPTPIHSPVQSTGVQCQSEVLKRLLSKVTQNKTPDSIEGYKPSNFEGELLKKLQSNVTQNKTLDSVEGNKPSDLKGQFPDPKSMKIYVESSLQTKLTLNTITNESLKLIPSENLKISPSKVEAKQAVVVKGKDGQLIDKSTGKPLVHNSDAFNHIFLVGIPGGKFVNPATKKLYTRTDITRHLTHREGATYLVRESVAVPPTDDTPKPPSEKASKQSQNSKKKKTYRPWDSPAGKGRRRRKQKVEAMPETSDSDSEFEKLLASDSESEKSFDEEQYKNLSRRVRAKVGGKVCLLFYYLIVLV